MTEVTLNRAAVGIGSWRDWLALSKARIVVMILLTTAAGFLFASGVPVDAGLLIRTLIATGLVAAGTNALNQYVERDYDKLMDRTQGRPLPSGRLTERAALVGSISAAVAGIGLLGFSVNWLSAFLAGVTLVTYLFLYTPLKRVTTWSTFVGSFPGAIPPLIGWAAVRGSLDLAAWVVFAIVFLWQMPHFFAIGWLYRADYARAGFAILSVKDTTGRRSGVQSIIYSILLLGVSVLPFVWGLSGSIYLAAASIAGLAMAVTSALFAVRRDRKGAGALFTTSILYLPVVLTLLVVDRAI